MLLCKIKGQVIILMRLIPVFNYLAYKRKHRTLTGGKTCGTGAGKGGKGGG